MPSTSALFRPSRVLVLLAVVLGGAVTLWIANRPGRVGTEFGGTGGTDRRPERVVLFGPNLVEAACAMGYEDRIVAITDYCRWPASVLDRPRVGGAIDPDLETLALLEPELLVLQGESRALRSFAREAGIEVADVTMDGDLVSVMAGILQLDDVLGGAASGRGEQLVESMQRQLAVLAPPPGAPRPTALLVLSREPGSLRQIFTAGKGTFLSDLLALVGATPWADRLGEGYFDVPVEELVADPPGLVIELRAPTPGLPTTAWSTLPDGGPRVEVLDFDGAMIPGPRVVETAVRLRDLLWPPSPEGEQ